MAGDADEPRLALRLGFNESLDRPAGAEDLLDLGVLASRLWLVPDKAAIVGGAAVGGAA